ncbi:hypothetical protein ElyMa_000202500 [Elysia marginata]|uniref:Uncharacterized protein n=1 Tax=Elysia marginata TaxID=1093978 RepID=A0AAV4EWK9_9GAST|nr:hypothetical protein ElyMa_000202500 [Elysia marginata]
MHPQWLSGGFYSGPGWNREDYLVCKRCTYQGANTILHNSQGSTGPCSSYYSCCDPTQLPCSGCRYNYCLKAHQDWTDFHCKVDDTIPLVVPISNHRTTQFVVCETDPQPVNAVGTAHNFEDKMNEKPVEPHVNRKSRLRCQNAFKLKCWRSNLRLPNWFS